MLNISIISKMDHIKSKPSGPAKNSRQEAFVVVLTTAVVIYCLIGHQFTQEMELIKEETVNVDIIDIVVVACGPTIIDEKSPPIWLSAERQFNQTRVMIKSAAIMTKKQVHIHMVVDTDDLFDRLEDFVNSMPEKYRNRIILSKYDVWYPKILYIDTDMVFLRPPEDIWIYFKYFNPDQMLSMTEEGMRYLTQGIPLYKDGINTGVVLMDLNKMRDPKIKWMDTMIDLVDNWKGQLRLGDQDLVNIYLADNPDKVLVLPCTWNFRGLNCKSGRNSCPLAAIDGASIIHGNANAFSMNGQWKMKMVYLTFQNFNMTHETPKDLIADLKVNLKEVNKRRLPSYCIRIPGIDEMLLKWPKKVFELTDEDIQNGKETHGFEPKPKNISSNLSQ